MLYFFTYNNIHLIFDQIRVASEKAYAKGNFKCTAILEDRLHATDQFYRSPRSLDSADRHSMLKRAPELQGRTMTDFMVAIVQAAAPRAIEQAEVIRLSLADQECFAQALLSLPQPIPALERAFTRRSKLLRAEPTPWRTIFSVF